MEQANIRLFLSYGHKEGDIAADIRDYLVNKYGQDNVWFDRTNIVHGDDWREKIAEGIHASNGVVACLSAYSVRDPGVCLDELSIAVGVSNAAVFPLLLEDVAAPSVISHIQWLDMTDWKAKKEAGEDAYTAWFAGKMQEVCRRIEDPKNREFQGQMAELRKLLSYPNIVTGKQKALLRKPFVGRKWLTEKIQNWIDDESPDSPRLCVLYGQPGIGKSAFAAHFCHYNPRVAAGFFCEYQSQNFSRPESVLRTLALLLAGRIPDYRQNLLSKISGQEKLGELKTDELFQVLLGEPLNHTVDGNHGPMCILIDGLDECGDSDTNALAQSLAKNIDRLPRWLKVLVTSREVSAVKHTFGDIPRFDLNGEDEQNMADIREYFTEKLQEKYGKEPVFSKAVDALTRCSQGIFLYAEMMTDAIRRGKQQLDDIRSFPTGLEAVFQRWFGWFFPEAGEYKSKYRMPMAVLAASPEPLPAEELPVIFPALGESEIGDFLRLIEVLLRRDTDFFEKETLTFSHKFLNEWLISDAAGLYRVSVKDARKEMANRFFARFEKRGGEKLSEYEALHICEFMRPLAEADGEAEEKYRKLITDNDLFWRILKIGDRYQDYGKTDAALRTYFIAEQMANAGRTVSEDPEVLRNYGASCNKVAGIYLSQGKTAEALELYLEGKEISGQLVQTRGLPEDLRDYSVSCNKVADIYFARGETAEALELYLEGKEIRGQLVQTRGLPEDRRDYSISCNRVADIYLAQGKTAEALELYLEAKEIREQLVQTRGYVDDYDDLAVSYYKLGSLTFLLQETRLDYARTGLEISQQLLEATHMPRHQQFVDVFTELIQSLS